MEFAQSTVTEERIRAAPGRKATCPLCKSPVIPKCGEVRVHHWAHKASRDCDPWAEPEGPWHREWKSYARPERREVVIGKHRADIISPDGRVIELQHSPLPVGQVREREEAYGENMVWLFDASAFTGLGNPCPAAEPTQGVPGKETYILDLYPKGVPCVIPWEHPREYVTRVTAIHYWDLGRGGQVMKVERFLTGIPHPFRGTWVMGRLFPMGYFISQVIWGEELREGSREEIGERKKVVWVVPVSPTEDDEPADFGFRTREFISWLRTGRGQHWAVHLIAEGTEYEYSDCVSRGVPHGIDLLLIYMGDQQSSLVRKWVFSKLTDFLRSVSGQGVHRAGTGSDSETVPVLIRTGGKWVIPYQVGVARMPRTCLGNREGTDVEAVFDYKEWNRGDPKRIPPVTEDLSFYRK